MECLRDIFSCYGTARNEYEGDGKQREAGGRSYIEQAKRDGRYVGEQTFEVPEVRCLALPLTFSIFGELSNGSARYVDKDAE